MMGPAATAVASAVQLVLLGILILLALADHCEAKLRNRRSLWSGEGGSAISLYAIPSPAIVTNDGSQNWPSNMQPIRIQTRTQMVDPMLVPSIWGSSNSDLLKLVPSLASLANLPKMPKWQKPLIVKIAASLAEEQAAAFFDHVKATSRLLKPKTSRRSFWSFGWLTSIVTPVAKAATKALGYIAPKLGDAVGTITSTSIGNMLTASMQKAPAQMQPQIEKVPEVKPVCPPPPQCPKLDSEPVHKSRSSLTTQSESLDNENSGTDETSPESRSSLAGGHSDPLDSVDYADSQDPIDYLDGGQAYEPDYSDESSRIGRLWRG